ncbi:hypothetical protein K488DRAFT_31752, partial [Vararia minispora EC-137]
QALIFTDGSCSRNGSDSAEGYWQVLGRPKVYRPWNRSYRIRDSHSISSQCVAEPCGNLNDGVIPTSARAKLTAAIEALKWIDPVSESFRSVVVATDLDLIVSGISGWAWRWRANGWQTWALRERRYRPIQNADLWEKLIDMVLRLEDQNVEVKFWKVPR